MGFPRRPSLERDLVRSGPLLHVKYLGAHLPETLEPRQVQQAFDLAPVSRSIGEKPIRKLQVVDKIIQGPAILPQLVDLPDGIPDEVKTSLRSPLVVTAEPTQYSARLLVYLSHTLDLCVLLHVVVLIDGNCISPDDGARFRQQSKASQRLRETRVDSELLAIDDDFCQVLV